LANSLSAKKRARQQEKRRQHNASLRSRMRTHIKKVQKAVDAGDRTAAAQALEKAVPVIDAMINKGIVHQNKAARHKSRLNRKVKALVQQSG
jgi:small subunit ribosomal protein S20